MMHANSDLTHGDVVALLAFVVVVSVVGAWLILRGRP